MENIELTPEKIASLLRMQQNGKKATKRYYERNRDEIKQRALERYRKKKEDPEFMEKRRMYSAVAHERKQVSRATLKQECLQNAAVVSAKLSARKMLMRGDIDKALDRLATGVYSIAIDAPKVA